MFNDRDQLGFDFFSYLLYYIHCLGAKCVEDQPLAGAARITEGGGQGAEAGDRRLR